MLTHVDVGILDLFGLKFEQMTVRTSTLLADSMIRFYDKGYYEYQKVLEPFSDKKFHSAWKRLYGHMLTATLDVSDNRYLNDHVLGDHYLFEVVNKSEGTPLAESSLEVLMQNKDAVLHHLGRIDRICNRYPAKRPLDSWVVSRLYSMGFSQILEVCGSEVFALVKDPRQLMIAQEAGITIEKDFVISKLLGNAYPPKEAAYQRMDSDAIVYMLESDEFSMEDLRSFVPR